jgi:large subunit ribosomal protein L9
LRKELSDMQVILIEDVKALGKKGEMVKVSDGYARNFIIPKKLGVEATQANLSALKQQKIKEEKIAAAELAAAKELADRIGEKTVKIKIRTGEGGKLFGAVASKEIAEAVKKQYDIDVDKKKIVLPDPMKTLGTHQVPLRLHKDVTATLNIVVTGD